MNILYNTNGEQEMETLMGFEPAHNGMCLLAVTSRFTLKFILLKTVTNEQTDIYDSKIKVCKLNKLNNRMN